METSKVIEYQLCVKGKVSRTNSPEIAAATFKGLADVYGKNNVTVTLLDPYFVGNDPDDIPPTIKCPIFTAEVNRLGYKNWK